MRRPATRIAVPLALGCGLALAVGCQSKWQTIQPLDVGADQVGFEVVGEHFDSCRPADRNYSEDGSKTAWRCYAQIAATARDFKKKEYAAFLEMKPDGGWILWHENEHFDAGVKDENDEKIACADQTEETKKAWEEREEAKKADKKSGKGDDEGDDEAKAGSEGPPAESGPEPGPEPEPEPADGTGSSLQATASAAAADGGSEGDDGSAAEGDDDSAGDWEDEPVLSLAEREDKHFEEKVRGKFCVEKARGTLTAKGEDFVLALPREHLPEGEMVVKTNGLWGLALTPVEGGERLLIGSGKEPAARIVSK